MMRSILREPLVHFLPLDLGIVGAARWWPQEANLYRIVMNQARVDHITAGAARSRAMQ